MTNDSFTLSKIDSWIINLLVVVQRCPAVPTDPNNTAGIANLRSASGVMMIALFPPNSRIVLPNLFDTTSAACLPTGVEPVTDMRGIFLLFNSISPTVEPLPTINEKIPSGKLFSFKT